VAANAVLDAWAQARQAGGAPGVSVQWGAWGGGGMAAESGVEARMERMGVGVLSPDQGMCALEAMLRHGGRRPAAALHWRRRRQPARLRGSASFTPALQRCSACRRRAPSRDATAAQARGVVAGRAEAQALLGRCSDERLWRNRLRRPCAACWAPTLAATSR
jgi:hypothetical protein